MNLFSKFTIKHLCGFLAAMGLLGSTVNCSAQYWTAIYLNTSSYSCAEGGSISGTVYREAYYEPFTTGDWNLSASYTAILYISGSGTYQIDNSDVTSGGTYYITIPANSYSANFTINFNDNTNLEYDRTGTLNVGDGQVDSSKIQSAGLTLYDNDSLVGVLFSASPVLEGGVSGANQTTLRFVRDVSVTQARTINYSVSGTAIAGTDYTPSSFGTVTIAQGSSEADVTVSANNSSQTANKTLTVSIASSPYYQIWSSYPNSTATILADHPNIGVYATSPTMTRNESTSSFTFYEDSYYPSYSQARTVNYTVSGTAANGVDFTPSLSGSIVIPAGVGSVTTSTLTPGTNLTGTKILTATITSGNYGILTNANPASIGILEDEPMINVTASGLYAYQNSQAGQFALTRSGELNKAVTVNYTVNGTATSGVNYTALPVSVTFAANQTTTNLNVSVTSSPTLTNAATVVLTLNTSTNYFLGVNSQAVVTLLPNSDTTNSVPSPVGRYWRGSGSDPTYWSQVVPLESETGTVYNNLYGNAYTLYGIGAWGSTYYHYNATNSLTQTNVANRIAFNNPIVAFGERVGGTPLYVNQSYSFGVYAGDLMPLSSPIQIIVYSRTNSTVGPVAGYILLYPPNVSNAGSWNNYSTNGFQVLTSTNYLANGVTGTTNNFGLITTLSDSPDLSWGTTSKGAYMLTHTANAQATNYYYLVEAYGTLDAPNMPMVQDGSNQAQPSELYTLEFEQRPAWRSVFLDQPHFDGSPLPPFYAGKTLAEMLTNTPPVTNVVSFAPSAATNLDDSPELRRHPILDNFVASMGNDPIALANYVINSIDLTDPMDYSDNGNVAEQSINPGGVSRGALGTFMEKQGSPVDQCALLVYLLRQAGVPAVYEFPPRNGMKILDARLSRMLKFQVHGGYSEAGQLYTTNTMIPVNYPWVAAYIGTNWVHIFPWLKDYQIVEGFNLYDEMPTNYSNAYNWVHDYVYGKTNLLSLAVAGDNTPRVIFPAYLQQTLLQNHPGISVGDIGVDIFNRQHYYARWQDFPTPTWVTNVSTPLESLTSSAITNISPTLTNIFDTVSVEIYSQTDPTKDIQTGDMRLVDLHDREFYVYQTATNSTQVKLSLILLPFRTNITSQFSFTNDAALTSKEVASMTLDQYDDQLTVRFKYYRHRALSAAYAIDPNLAFLGLNAGSQLVFERPLRKGDQAAICMSYGTVTRDMLNVHATDIWQMENALRANPSLTNSVSPDVYEGATMYLAGMSYYEKVAEFDQLNQHLHKINTLSFFAAGLSKIGPARDSSGNLTNNVIYPVLPNVDMFFYEAASVGNGTTQPDSGQNDELADQNYNLIAIADGSAEEHQVINTYYQQTNAVSTVRLLQLAQSSGAGIVSLNINNYAAQGTTTYQGKQLQSWDSNLWSQVTTAFQGSDGSYVTAYITPGPMTNSAYKGMAALILGWSEWQALISPQSLNGGFGQPFQLLSTVSPANTLNYNLNNNDSFTMTLNQPASGTTFAPISAPDFNYQSVDNSILNNSLSVSYYDSTWNSSVNTVYNLPSTGTANQNLASAFQTSEQSGFLGEVGGMVSQALTAVADPVQPITGEFYIDETDLQLPGPIPLSLRRNYSSENLADNQFGAGWKFSIMPYLSVTTGSTNIYAADMDGAVLAYVQTSTNANVWLPTLAANPQLNNNTTAGAGGLVNRLRDRIILTGTTNYTLYAADGSVRTFQTMTFNNGILNQTRPYLQKWTDSRGNYYAFSYGTDSTQPNFGEVTRIQCSNGNYLGFDYDIYGHIIDAYCGDGRRLTYDYDQYGDLVTVTLPDATTRSYQYQHLSQAVTNGSAFYSTHLIVEEDKPDGRALINAYDANRRVTNQLSTAGVDLTPIRTATFVFANNFNITNSFTNAISGYTFIIDGNGNTNRYDYTNSLITQVTDPLGQTVQQTWYADNATAPGYPRSVATRKDKRGLLTQFKYDANGNVTNTVTTGDITGDGITSQTATNTALYNPTNNLPVQITDAAGNGMAYVYDPTFNFMPQQTIRYAGGAPVSTNFMFYGNATNVVINGSTTQTNLAFGVLTRQVRAYGSTDAATNDTAYDGHGFPIQSIRYTGTGDPNVVNTYFYNERGNQVNQTDALGAFAFSDYDAIGRPIEQENFDEHGNALAWSFNYYNDNGEISWIDGPRYNPEDYVFYDYDGAGRPTTEIHWRSQANSDGSGVSAPSGYNLYAQTFYQYDPLGNLTLKVDPRGAETTNTWNAVCELVQTKHLDVDGVTVLSKEGFAYEAGGQVRFYTNALGGVTETEYTTAGKPEYRHNADGSTNAMRYYFDGRVKREIQSNGAYWQTTYDDFNLITTRVFYSAAGVPEATNSIQLDRRGNVIQRVDAGGNAFTTTYDGLDRAKVTAGPAIVTIIGGSTLPGGPITYTTNVLQQVSTNFYDAAGRSVTNVNALGETTVTTSDALGRVTSTKIYGTTGTLVRESYTGYSADHNSITTTNGSGASAIVNTTYTDTDGHNVLSIAYPAAGYLDYTWQDFDLSGNLDYQEHDSSASGSISGWTFTSLTHDGLNRVISKEDRDYALTYYAYDSLSDLTNRTMPGGLQWQAAYNNAGQMLQEQNVGGGNGTRTNTYSYFSSGSPFAGLLQTKNDGRSTACTYAYDDWLRPTNMSCSGSLPEQNLTTAWQYEPRGFVTGITEQFASTNTGAATSVQRSYDPYGQLSSESVSAGSFGYGAGQSFDAAGRRSQLGIGSGSYGFGWRADGALISAGDSTGTGAYSYDTAGLLTNRNVGVRNTTITSRDGEGRPFTVVTYVSGVNQMTESLSWFLDGTLATHTLYRADFTDSRAYTYAGLSRRLVQEQQNLNGSTLWTNNLTYDNGASSGAGVLTRIGQGSTVSNSWSGTADAFSRVSTETNNTYQYAAYGHVNGQSTLSGWLDNQPVSVTGVGTNAMQWRAMLELSPGVHQLKMSALHPSGFYTAWATNSFTNNIAYQTTADTFDGAGNITQRLWKNPNGTTNRTQTLSWDARGRLHAVTERDSSNSGYNWTATYDGLNRRLSTTTISITNGVALTAPPTTINSYYDPQVEFLELGVSYGITTEWKLYGPDLNGVYGGLNGTGGFDAVSPYLNLFDPTISDIRGNILGYYDPTKGSVTWNPSRPTGYGAVPDYRPVALANGASVAQSSAWRGHWVDITGYYNIGLRPYDPISGQWLTYDSAWNERDPNYYTFAGGEPIAGFDPDGRFTKGAYQGTVGMAEGAGTLLWDVGGSIGYGVTSVFSQDAANDIYGNQMQGLENVGNGLAYLGSQTLQGNLGTVVDNLTGGANQSGAYRVGYAAPMVASFLFGGEAADAGEAGSAGDVGNGVRAAETSSEAAEQTTVAADQAGQIIQETPPTTVVAQQIMEEGNAALSESAPAAPATAAASAAAEDTAFSSTLNKVGTLDFSTPPNGAVFYSGAGQGAKAAAFAEQSGGMTIEMTQGGQDLMADPVFQTLSPGQQYQIWQAASTPFAQGASGSINAFINGARTTGTFRTIEEPILNVNPNVFKSTYHY
jgi:RHS repeat-associated protein